MRIFVKAKPGAVKDKVEKINSETFRVATTEPPMQGKANRAIAQILAEYFETAPSNVILVSGFTSRNKIFDIYSSK